MAHVGSVDVLPRRACGLDCRVFRESAVTQQEVWCFGAVVFGDGLFLTAAVATTVTAAVATTVTAAIAAAVTAGVPFSA